MHVAVLADGEVLYTHKASAPEAFIMRSRVGSRMPAHSTAVGKVMLSTLPEARVVATLTARGMRARTPATLTDVDALLAELEVVREAGYALDREENEVNVRCMAVPIRLGDNGIAGVSISTITFLTPEPALLACSRDCAHRRPAPPPRRPADLPVVLGPHRSVLTGRTDSA